MAETDHNRQAETKRREHASVIFEKLGYQYPAKADEQVTIALKQQMLKELRENHREKKHKFASRAW